MVKPLTPANNPSRLVQRRRLSRRRMRRIAGIAAAGLLTIVAVAVVIRRTGSEASLTGPLDEVQNIDAGEAEPPNVEGSDSDGNDSPLDPDSSDDPNPNGGESDVSGATDTDDRQDTENRQDTDGRQVTDLPVTENRQVPASVSGADDSSAASGSSTTKPQRTTTTKPAGSTTVAETGAGPTTTPPATTQKPSTSVPAPTTAAPTTAPVVPFEGQVIASPVAGEVLAWDTKTTFMFNPVPGAVSYCLSLDSNGSVFRRCTRTLQYDLIRSSKNVDPGPLSLKVEVFTEDGRALAVEEISIDLVVSDLALDLQPGRVYEIRKDTLIVRSRKVPTADDYCWIIIQEEFVTNSICSADRIHSIHLRFTNFLVPGPATIIYVASRGDEIVAEQSVTVAFG